MQAQEPHYSQFSEEDGLPPSGVILYSTIQYSKGYIWISSAEGIARYDGQRFERFTTQNGLLKNEVWYFFEDNYGHIWLQSNFNEEMKVQYFDLNTNRLVTLQLPANKVLHRKPKNQSLSAGQLAFEMIDSQTIGIYLRVYTDSTNAHFYAFVKPSAMGVEVVNAPKTLMDGFPKKVSFSGFSATAIDGTIWRYWNNKWQAVCKTKNLFTTKTQVILSQRIFLNDSITIFSIGQDVVRWHNRKGFLNKYRVNGASPFNFVDIKSKKLVLLDTSNGIVLLNDRLEASDYTANFDFMKDWRAKTVLIDRQQNLWITTNDNVLRMVSGQALLHSQNYDLNEAARHLVQDPTGRIWIGMQSGKLLYSTGTKWQATNLSSPFTQFIRGMACAPNGDLWIVNDRQIAKINISKAILPQIFILNDLTKQNLSDLQTNINTNFVINSGAYKSVKIAQNKVWLTSSGQGFGVESIKNTYHFSEATNGRCYALQPTNKGLFVGRLDGVYLQTDSLRLVKNIPKVAINDLAIIKNELYVATQSDGLYVYDIVGQKTKKIEAIGNDNIHKLAIDHAQNLWICTQTKGLIKWGNGRAEFVTMADGLPTNDVYDVLATPQKLTVATAKGITVIDSDIIQPKVAEPLVLQSLRVRNQKRDSVLLFPDNRSKLILDNDQNNLTVTVNNLDYHAPKSRIYSYVLVKNLDTVSLTSKAERIHELRFLEAGDYILTVSTDNAKPVSFAFTILTPFYLRWWFWLLVGGLVAAVVYYRIRQNIKRAAMELRALQGQMNAHFAANFMEVVKNMVVKENKIAAFNSLSIFGGLMRDFVVASRNKKITIGDEIEFLKRYIELARLVYGLKKTDEYDKTLTDEIVVDAKIDLNSYIRPLLIQPIVENVFKYGIFHKESPSCLWIWFEVHGSNTIKCIIEDDGVGRRRVAQIQEQEKIDLNLVLKKELTAIKGSIQSMKEAGVKITIIDLPQGTRVELILDILNPTQML
jgi:ligand-binding sensor domain-containing protein